MTLDCDCPVAVPDGASARATNPVSVHVQNTKTSVNAERIVRFIRISSVSMPFTRVVRRLSNHAPLVRDYGNVRSLGRHRQAVNTICSHETVIGPSGARAPAVMRLFERAGPRKI